MKFIGIILSAVISISCVSKLNTVQPITITDIVTVKNPIEEHSITKVETTTEEILSQSDAQTPAPPSTPLTEVVPVYSEADNYNISDLARRIRRWKHYIDKNIWYECGVKYTPDEIKTASNAWASAIVNAHNTVTYLVRGKRIKVPLKEAVGIIMSESRFDSCAIGPHPRTRGYKLKILTKKPGTISHTKDDLQKLYESPKFKGYLADIGPGQIVKKIGEGYMEWPEIKTYIDLETGVLHLFTELASRGSRYQTKNPSSRWPGSLDHSWYTTKILGFSAYLWNDELYTRRVKH